ncbi:hypothetical protein D3C87_165350 [compost metagenome]
MKQMLKFAAILVMVSQISGCLPGCENEIRAVVISPSGKTKAVVFGRDCGATTGFNTQISIIAVREDLPDEGGNAFIAQGKIPLQIQWESEAELNVSGLGAADRFKQEQIVRGVRLIYEN